MPIQELYADIDAYSGLCYGYSLGWEGGTYSLNQLMINIIKDKKHHTNIMNLGESTNEE